MKIHYYLSLIPDSLIASMLPPEEFGSYYALGSHKRSRGQAIFFEIDPDKAGGAIDREMVRHAVSRMKTAVRANPATCASTAPWNRFRPKRLCGCT